MMTDLEIKVGKLKEAVAAVEESVRQSILAGQPDYQRMWEKLKAWNRGSINSPMASMHEDIQASCFDKKMADIEKAGEG